jgi:Transposase DDE domain
MHHRTQGRVFRQINSAQERLAGKAGLPFSQLLDATTVKTALADDGISFRERIYTPWATLWIFLSQVLDPNQCCLQAVLRFLAYRLAEGMDACSSETGAYCQARQRLPENVLKQLARTTGQQTHQREMPAAWRWKGRPVKVADGTTLSMPDTPANQQAYPQPSSQKPGVGFPLLRIVVLFSLAVGTVLETAIGQYKGKQTGEVSLLRTLHDSLDPNDVLLGDRIYCTYFDIALLRERSVDAVVRLHQQRRADFRRGRRLGRNDHLVVWTKPRRPDWMDEETYRRLPDTLTVREVRVRVNVPGFRSETIIVVTTLLDAETYSVSDLAELYRARWHAELDLRSLKQTLKMDVLRCETPAMVRKEIWVHLLAYNLIRKVMADAAEKHGILPREISFASALETLLAFAPYLARMSAPSAAEIYYAHMLDALVRHRVGDRPDRCEPRLKKRRPKAYGSLQEPRPAARKRCRKRRKG